MAKFGFAGADISESSFAFDDGVSLNAGKTGGREDRNESEDHDDTYDVTLFYGLFARDRLSTH